MNKLTTIEAQAAEWLDLMDRAALDSEDGQEFDRWMQSNALHRRAFAEMAALWRDQDVAQACAEVEWEQATPVVPVAANDGDQSASGSDDLVATAASLGWRAGRWGLGMSLAVTAALAVVTVVQGIPRDFVTAPGERADVALIDGSQIALGGNSAVEVQMWPWRRSVELVRGEASFDVAHEENRTFTVQVDDMRVEVLGTQFRIDRLASGRALIDVASGRVRVGTKSQELILTTDQAAIAGPTELARVTLEPEQRIMGGEWFVANETPLPDLIEKLRRFAPGNLTLSSKAALDARITGRFNVRDLKSTLYLLENVYGFRVVEKGGDIFITK